METDTTTCQAQAAQSEILDGLEYNPRTGNYTVQAGGAYSYPDTPVGQEVDGDEVAEDLQAWEAAH